MAAVVAPAIQPYLDRAVETTNRVARTFAVATRLLPREVRPDVYLLYLVCRQLDDLVDFQKPDAERRLGWVARWAERGEVRGPEAEILQHLADRYPTLPRDAVTDFCEGQRQDMGTLVVDTEADLDLYAYRVAGTVGRLMATILGAETEAADEASRALGIAMQRTNILRGIDEDLARGRVYIPAQALAMAGVQDLARDDRTLLLRVEIAVADHWYELGLPGSSLLKHGGRQVRAAGVMYRQILRQIEREGRGVQRPKRVVVPSHRKLLGLVQGLVQP